MNIPSFTAEATLYNTRGHYRAARPAINLVTQTVDTIRLALGISDEGPIEVHACRPGFVPIGEGPNIVCVDPRDPFGTRGHDGGSGPGDVGGVPTDTGGGGTVPPPFPQTCSMEQLNSPAGRACLDQGIKEIKDGVRFPHYVNCSKNKKGDPIMGCCQDFIGGDGKRHRKCTPI